MLKNLRKLPLSSHFLIHLIITLSGVFIGLVSSQFSRDGSLNPGMIAALMLMAAGIGWHLAFVRCPRCGSHLPLRRPIPHCCPDCGRQLL